MVNSKFVFEIKNKVRQHIIDIIVRYNKMHGQESAPVVLSKAFKLNIPPDFVPGDNIINVITTNQKNGEQIHFANVILVIDENGGVTDIIIDVLKEMKLYSGDINEPMPKRKETIIDKKKVSQIVGVLFEAADKLRNAGKGTVVPRGTTPGGLLDMGSGMVSRRPYTQTPVPRVNDASYIPTYRSTPQSAVSHPQTDSIVSVVERQPIARQESLIKPNPEIEADYGFREFVKRAPRWYRSILDMQVKQKVKEYVYEIWKKTSEQDDVVWQMITGEFVRKGMLRPTCQLFPERNKFSIGEDGSVHCEWTNCQYRRPDGSCNHIRLRYGR